MPLGFTTTLEGSCASRSELADLPLFRGVEQELLADLAGAAEYCRVTAGTSVVMQDQNVECLRLIRRGIIELFRDEGEHEVGVLLLSSGDLVVPASAIWSEPSLLTARALTTCRLLEIDAGIVASATRRSSLFSYNLMMVMGGQWRMVVRSLLDLTCRTAVQRLSAFLLRLVDIQSNEICPQLPFSKRHLASRLGMSPETLSRALHTLAVNGLHLRGRAIIVRDRPAVERLCGADPYSGRNERSLNVFAI